MSATRDPILPLPSCKGNNKWKDKYDVEGMPEGRKKWEMMVRCSGRQRARVLHTCGGHCVFVEQKNRWVDDENVTDHAAQRHKSFGVEENPTNSASKTSKLCTFVVGGFLFAHQGPHMVS